MKVLLILSVLCSSQLLLPAAYGYRPPRSNGAGYILSVSPAPNIPLNLQDHIHDLKKPNEIIAIDWADERLVYQDIFQETTFRSFCCSTLLSLGTVCVTRDLNASLGCGMLTFFASYIPMLCYVEHEKNCMIPKIKKRDEAYQAYLYETARLSPDELRSHIDECLRERKKRLSSQ